MRGSGAREFLMFSYIYFQQFSMSKQKSHLQNAKNNSQTESERVRQAFFEYVENFCNTATLHGLRYIVEPKRHWFEKCFWIISLVIVTIGAVIIVQAEVKNFSESPVVMSVSGEIVPVWNIPFPAITFCSRNQIRPSVLAKIEGIKEDLRINVSDMEQAFCRADSDDALFNKNYYFKGTLDKNSSIKWSKIFDEQCNEIVKHMAWKNQPLGESSCKYIQWTSTEQGVCHTFNMLPKSQIFSKLYFESLTNSTKTHKPPNWMPETGFTTLDEEAIPWRVAGGSLFSSASLFLDLNRDDMSDTCKGKGYGFMIIVHSPADLPHGHQPVFVEVDMLSMIIVTPRIVSTSRDLGVWSPTARGCYFHHERSLLFYSIYTQHNCKLECEANVTLQTCKCNMFYQPHELHVPLCDETKMECVLSVLSNPHSTKLKGEACNCLPACTEYYYDFELSSMPRNWSYHESSRLSFYGFNIIGNKTKSYLALKVEYAERRVSVMSRVGIFTISDFIANLGGLLGLFIGFSFVSLMEIVYFGPLNIFGYLLEALGKKMNKVVSKVKP